MVNSVSSQTVEKAGIEPSIIEQIEVGDRIIIDPIYGAEEVLTIETGDFVPHQAGNGQRQPLIPISFPIVKLYLRNKLHNQNPLRYAVRFPNESCIKVIDDSF